MYRHVARLFKDLFESYSHNDWYQPVNTPDFLFEAHPAHLAMLLEVLWKRRYTESKGTGHPDHRSNLDEAPLPTPQKLSEDQADHAKLTTAFKNFLRITYDDPYPTDICLKTKFRWDHLIYAYMIENTRLCEIFRRVVFEYAHGEKLGSPSEQGQAWLRNTEELFFKDGAPFLITSISSHLRPDSRANRRNAYQRMFGMELNHGTDDGKPYSYVKADAANNDFVSTFEEFLYEVQLGRMYVKATSSSNPTDNAKIAMLAKSLKNMLMSRRQYGNLSREEYSAVTAMAWFHMTLEYRNTNESAPIIKDLRAEASSPEQRLFKVAERVGLPAHGLSKHFFSIADAISRILIQIETGDYDFPEAVPALYTPLSEAFTPEAAMGVIITNWTAITGRNLKALKVAIA